MSFITYHPQASKRSYKNAPSGEQLLTCAVFQVTENGLFPWVLLNFPFGDVMKLVSSLCISRRI